MIPSDELLISFSLKSIRIFSRPLIFLVKEMTAPKAQKKPAEKKSVGSISSHEIQQEVDDHAEGDPDHREIGHAR